MNLTCLLCEEASAQATNVFDLLMYFHLSTNTLSLTTMDSSSFGSWSKSLPLAEELSELLASELLSDGLDTKECRLEQIVDLEKDENRLEIICSKFKERLKQLLKDSIALLRTALINQVTDQSNFSHKFALSVSDEEMECGTIENFHKGLQDRIGDIALLCVGFNFQRKIKWHPSVCRCTAYGNDRRCNGGRTYYISRL